MMRIGKRMNSVYAQALYYKKQEFLDNIKFYFKQTTHVSDCHDFDSIEDLVRPRLRIAIVTETWSPEINGVALSLLQLCKGLQKQGHKILLIRPEQKNQCKEFEPNKECLVKAQSIPKYTDMQFGLPQYLKVSQAISNFSPNVVHIVTEGPLGFAALQAAKSNGIPVSSGFHSSFHELSRFFDLAFLLKPIQKYLRWFHNSTQLTCVPSLDTEKALRQFGITCPLVVVGGGVDVERFSPQYRSESLRQKWGVNKNTRVMLYVGRLSPEKEIGVLLEAYAAIQKQNDRCVEKSRDVKLVIVGDGPDKSDLEKMPSADRVIFTGSLSGIQLAEAYASADVFVFASQVETFGNVVLEAMASGLPVVAYDNACSHLHIKHQVSGWLSPLGEKQHFIQQVLNLPDNQTLHRMGEVAVQDVKNIGWKYPVQQLEQALYSVVQETYMVT